MNTLSVSRVVNISIVLSPKAAQGQNLSNLLVLGNSNVITTTERLREYTDIDAVEADFGGTAPEYLAAQAWFGQVPQPSQILIGRWAQTATHGELVCGLLAPANQPIAVWNAITAGSFKVAIDGGGVTAITGLNFSAALTLSGVAAIITAGLTGATCSYDSVQGNFIFQSNTTGATSSVSFLTDGTSGTNIAHLLAGTNSSNNGAFVSPGIAAETALTAAALFANNYGQQWYALVMPTAVDADHEAVAPFIEATTAKHIYGVTTQEAGVLSAVSTSDIAYILSQAGYNRSVVQYSSSSAYAICSYLGRKLTVDYTGNSTAITMKFKQEPGITFENLTETQANALEAKNCNVFVEYDNNTAIIEQGVQCSGLFTDIITDVDNFAVTLQTALYNKLYTSLTKIPQTDAGVHDLVTTANQVSEQFYVNGVLGTGIWTEGGFGTLKTGDLLPHGYYVYAASVNTQTMADRAARKSPPIQIAAKLAGAIHSVAATIYVNQ